jgi:hypothetical protein
MACDSKSIQRLFKLVFVSRAVDRVWFHLCQTPDTRKDPSGKHGVFHARA